MQVRDITLIFTLTLTLSLTLALTQKTDKLNPNAIRIIDKSLINRIIGDNRTDLMLSTAAETVTVIVSDLTSSTWPLACVVLQHITPHKSQLS
jgi:hypothetical protein